MTPEQQAIRKRRKAVFDSIDFYDRQHRDFVLRAITNLEYVQADCPHLDITSQYEISHFVRVCSDCQKVL
jgi:hypothetical protein